MEGKTIVLHPKNQLNIIILGPPGSGKGTFASRLSPKIGIIHISTGDIVREEMMSKTELGKEMEKYVLSGELVPDEIMIKVLNERLNKPDSSKGFILDGFPRTILQAEALSRIVNINVMIVLNVPKEILIKKIFARRVCKRCGDIYNVANIDATINGIHYKLPSLPSKKPGICNKCSSELYQRKDDNLTVIKERLKVYEDQSKPVINYFAERVPSIQVNVNREPKTITYKILEELEKNKMIKKMGNEWHISAIS